MNKREINNKDEFRCGQFYDSLIHFLEYQSNPFYRTDEMGVYDACFYVEIEEKEYPIVGIKKLYCSTEEEIAKQHLFYWNRNDVPISILILPGEVRLYNNFSCKKGKALLYKIQDANKMCNCSLLNDLKASQIVTKVVWERLAELSNPGERVDKQLLFNLKSTVLQACNEYGMELEKAYNFMSQCIFIKYLEDRNMLTKKAFEKWNVNSYTQLLEQGNSEYIYEFFCFLKRRFNGDLFSIKKDDIPSNEQVTVFYNFFRGDDYLQDGYAQLRLFPYDFSVIPISLISNIYETFFSMDDEWKTKKKAVGAFYTPHYLADFMVQQCFVEYVNKKKIPCVLDPACGSGVFLVSAFKRQIEMLKREKEILSADDLTKLMTEKILGVDVNPSALRISCFSLYIALLDELTPKDILENQFHFPNLIGENLIQGSFFSQIVEKNISGKFIDIVVGNPPWIAWKAMSKSYRAGTLTIWQSYGIFEKNAYDKKTTHDDFGMAVTYVSVDQYLKIGGSMVFLLPASFLKSTKGGEGFRKFKIIRNNQSIPFKVEEVHDFSGVSLFTIPTVAIKFGKGIAMQYPMEQYRFYFQIGRKSKIDSHADWKQVSEIVDYSDCLAQPVDKEDLQSAWLTLKDMTFANNVVNPEIERIYKGRKGIEPAGAKGVYILLKPKKVRDGYLEIINDMSRQRRQDIIDRGVHKGVVEEKYIYPMLGGRNIARWMVKSHEYMIVPHSSEYKYGIPAVLLAREAPETFQWLSFYHDELLDTRIQNGKFFNQETQPFYRLDNVGTYTYSPYKVLWKEQTGSMSAVVVSSYLNSIPDADVDLFMEDKPVVVDSKVLMLDVYDEMEAYYICGIINSPSVIEVVDGYAISTNRGVDVLKYIAIKKFDETNAVHRKIAEISKNIHDKMRETSGKANIIQLENALDEEIHKLFS